MATLETRVESYVGSGDMPITTDLDEFFKDGTAKHLLLLGEAQKKKYSQQMSVDPAAGLPVDRAIIVDVHKAGNPALQYPSTMKSRFTSQDSIYEATETSPVFYLEAGNLFVEPGGGDALVIKVPEISSGVDEAISVLPEDLEAATVIYCALQLLHRSIATAVGDIVAESLNMPTPPTAPALPTAPVFNAPTKPSLTENYSDLDSAITDDDIELAGTIIEEIRTQLIEYQRDVEAAVGEFNAKINAFVSENNAEVSMYRAQVEAYMADVNAEIQRFTSHLEVSIRVVTAKIEQMKGLRVDYNQYLALYQQPQETLQQEES